MAWIEYSRLTTHLRVATRTALVLTLATVVGAALSSPAHAYIDPGSAAIVTQLVIGAFAGIGAYIGHKVKLFQKLFSRGKGKDRQARGEESNP